MIERFAVAAARIRQELGSLEQVVNRAERALAGARQNLEDSDLYLDSVALNLHDFYAGLERVFRHIGLTVDRSVPTGRDWHRELLQQMGVPLADIRPPVLSGEAVKSADEYLRFRHVVQNIYAFEFDPGRVETLVLGLRPAFERLRGELTAFADFLDDLARRS